MVCLLLLTWYSNMNDYIQYAAIAFLLSMATLINTSTFTAGLYYKFTPLCLAIVLLLSHFKLI